MSETLAERMLLSDIFWFIERRGYPVNDSQFLKLHRNILLLKQSRGISSEAPVIYEFTDYRNYIKAVIDYRRGRRKAAGSLRAWSVRFGFASHSHLLLVLKGDRKMPLERIQNISNAFGLSPEEEVYLNYMIRASEALDGTTAELYRSKMEIHLTQLQFKLIAQSELEFFSDWVNLATLEVLRNFPYGATVEEILAQFDISLTREQVTRALELMEKIGFATQQENIYKAATNIVFRSEQIPTTATRDLHRSTAKVGARYLESKEQWGPSSKFISTTLTLTPDGLEKVRNLMNELNAFALGQEPQLTSQREIVQLNIHMFPVSKTYKPGSEGTHT